MDLMINEDHMGKYGIVRMGACRYLIITTMVSSGQWGYGNYQ